jgi:quinoprotein glucose dehydrogenase
VVREQPDARSRSLALDLTAKVLSSGNEEGLLGIAFHPKFKTTTRSSCSTRSPSSGQQRKRDPDTRNIVARFEMDPKHEKILPETEKVILESQQPYENHNGGVLQFGPDGYLYIGLGDGGAANDPHGNGQNMASMLGKFLRIDVDHAEGDKAYSVPKDNPLRRKGRDPAGDLVLGLAQSLGLPLRPEDRRLWSGDVGQDKWEEINIVRKGGNYGWNVREAMHDFKPVAGAGPFEEPLVEHAHAKPKMTDGANSITGGCVYRGAG